jgi:hypothetical protein
VIRVTSRSEQKPAGDGRLVAPPLLPCRPDHLRELP